MILYMSSIYMYITNTSKMTELFMKFIDTNNNFSIRGTVADNGTDYYLSVIDFINHACLKNSNSDYGRIWRVGASHGDLESLSITWGFGELEHHMEIWRV